MELEKGKLATMTSANFMQKARRALGPMRKAVIDAFLLGTPIIIFAYASNVLTFPLLIIFVYGLVYLIAVVLRLRKAATNSPAEKVSPIDYTAFTLAHGGTREITRTPPEM